MSIRQIPRLVWILLIVSLAFCALVVLDVVTILRGDYADWRWSREAPEPARLIPLALAVAAYLAGLVIWWRVRRWWILPTWATLCAVLIILATAWVGEDDVLFALFANTVSGASTGPHMAAVEIAPDVGAALRQWPALLESYWGRLIHVAVAPPGLPLLYLGASALLGTAPSAAHTLSMALRPYQCHNLAMMAYTDAQIASAWLGVLMPAWAALTVWPIYGIGRRLGGHEAGVCAAAWWPLVPGMALFTPTWNTFFPLIAACALWLMVPGQARTPRRGFLAGLLMGVGMFLTFALMPVLLFLGLYVLLDDLLIRRVSWRESVKAGLWFGLGGAIPWALYWAVSGVTPVDIVAAIMGLHLGFDRPYWPWVWLHVYDFVLFAGLPFIALALWRAASEARRRQAGALGVSLALTILVADLTHMARGETGRIWLLFVPYVLVAAASAAPMVGQSRRGSYAAITAAGAIILLMLAAFLRPMSGVDLQPPPIYPPPGDLPLNAQAVDVNFGDVMTLRAFAGEVRDDQVHLTLRWEGRERIGKHYWFSALLVGPDGTVGGKLDWPSALYDLPPTTCWEPGQAVQYTVQIPLEGLASESIWASVSVFDYDTGERLPVLTPGVPPDDQIGLGPINLP